MHYVIAEAARVTTPKVAEIIDTAALHGFLEEQYFTLDGQVNYIGYSGELQDQGPYTLGLNSTDRLLVIFEDGSLAVASQRGLRQYMRSVGQEIPPEIEE